MPACFTQEPAAELLKLNESAVLKYNDDHGSYGQPAALQAPVTVRANPVADLNADINPIHAGRPI